MKKILINDYGSVDVLFDVEEPLPTITENELLIKLVAAGINDVDVVIRKNGFPETVQNQKELPHSLGNEFSGVVTQVGDNITKFEVGDHVIGLNSLETYSEYIVVDENNLVAKVPNDADLLPLGGLTVVSITAWSAVILNGEVQPDQRVLIHGGAGGVGSMAIQLAKNAGAYVITTASAKDRAYLESLGADEVIDYRNEDFTNIVKDIDLVVHTVDKETQEKSFDVIKPGGKLISVSIVPDQEKVKEYDIEAKFVRGDVRSETLASILALYFDKKLLLHINKLYPFSLENVKFAQVEFEKGPNRGKRIIEFNNK
ncbi:oxidoreductase [Staphylococcus equorum]|uniref:NADP-dependent oxidoreductase n=1 Tax=Staphylococcus equorum TaxID=246432 RepID=UPI000D1CE3DD|nr:NADP-dependent oxidoreductase [Staphylococcus equorum]PTE43625.1 oxidoreductase [Staphylococcus equorum]PTE84594.1 oxidoreductase [Staphylococcus equorum]PTF12534.1 oxidoreductase [Staphylococcus equorum]RIL47283.1 NADP-dependent oxidoreductase [Staphylococcus equorum]